MVLWVGEKVGRGRCARYGVSGSDRMNACQVIRRKVWQADMLGERSCFDEYRTDRTLMLRYTVHKRT